MDIISDSIRGDLKTTRVLIVKTSSLGDIIHALPAVHALKTGLPAVIDWVVNSEYEELTHCFSDVRKVIPFPRHAPVRLPAFRRALQNEEYDLILDMQGLLKSALIVKTACGKLRIGPSTSREGSRWFYDEITGPPNQQRHAIEQNFDFVRHLGVKQSATVFAMQFPKFSVDTDTPRVVLIPNSRWPSKNWPANYFVETGRELRDRANAELYIIGGPADTALCARIAGGIGQRAVNLAGKLSLPELGARLAVMHLAITNDSGPMHLAAALNIPVIALFGPTDPIRTGPYGEIHTVFKERLLCRPCYRKRCRYAEEPACLGVIHPAKVVTAAINILMKQTTVTVR